MDSEVFKQRFIPLHKKLFRVAYRLLENTSDAEDAVQETYIKLWEKRDELEVLRNPESFSVVMIKNLCMDMLRSARNRTDSFEVVFKDKADESTFIADYEARESISIIEKIVENLPDQQKMVFRLRHQDDCSLEEIEQITGLSAVNIRVILSRIRKTIKEKYNEQYSNETYRNQKFA